MTQTMTPPDARSSVKVFEAHLRTMYVSSRAKDIDFHRHGFDFIKTKADVDDFLNELDMAPRSQMSLGCTKARVIRSYLDKQNDSSDEDYIQSFKIRAARARRTCCSCHETGSYVRERF